MRPLVLAAGVVVFLALHTTALAQCIARSDTGCPGEPPVICAGPPAPCAPPPSGGCGFTLSCAPTFPATAPCTGLTVILFGNCLTPAVPIDFPLGCATAGCSLGVGPLVGSFSAPLTVPPNLMPPGSFWCVQCACIAVDGTRPCVNLGQTVTLVIQP